MGVNGTLTLTLGSTPSVPCRWESPTIRDPSVIRQVDHRSEWPAPGATPMPGAPGIKIWILESIAQGESTVSLECVCLGEEGSGEEVNGVFVTSIVVRK